MKIKYSLDKLINDDELASLWQARLFLDDNDKEHKVIVKSLKHTDSIDNASLNRFRDLANGFLHVKCPSLVQLFDFGLFRKNLFITQEYVEGCSLEQILHALSKKQLHLPLWFTSLMLIPVLQAVKTIHSGTRHPDTEKCMPLRRITPSKIMLGARGAVKLTECGILSHFFADDHNEDKIKYRQSDDSQNISADIHSIGIILCKCLTGNVPSIEYPLSAILSDNNWLPPEIVSILKKALSMDIGSRFSKIEDLSYALGNYLKSSGYRISNIEFMSMVSILNSINKNDSESQKQIDICFAKIEQTVPQHIQWFSKFRNAFEKSDFSGSDEITDPLMHFSAKSSVKSADEPVPEKSSSEFNKSHGVQSVSIKSDNSEKKCSAPIRGKNLKTAQRADKSPNVDTLGIASIDQDSSGSSGDMWVSTRTLRLSGLRMRNSVEKSELLHEKSKNNNAATTALIHNSEETSDLTDKMQDTVNHKIEFELGLDALRKKDYQTALHHFEAAYLNDPENKIYRTNLKRIKSILNK